MKSVITALGFAVVLISAAHAERYTGKILGTCDTGSRPKNIAADVVEVKNGETTFQDYQAASGKYVVSARTKSDCTFQAEGQIELDPMEMPAPTDRR